MLITWNLFKCNIQVSYQIRFCFNLSWLNLTIVCSQDSCNLVEWDSCYHLGLNTTLIISTLDLEETWNEKTQKHDSTHHIVRLCDIVLSSPKPWFCRTFISPVTVPGVCSQPVGCPILLSPAEDLDGVTAQHLPCHMLVHTYSTVE